MEILKHTMPDNFDIMDTSDYHLGAANCARSSLRELIQTVAEEENTYLINKGDSIEAITPGDKRFKMSSVDTKNKILTPEDQADWLIREFEPIKHKILAWGLGNHEYTLLNTMDFGGHIAKALDVPYGAVCYKIHFMGKDGKLMFKSFHAHGNGNAPKGAKDPIQRKANRQAWLKRRLEGMAGDCVYMSIGHGHHILITTPTADDQLYLTDTGKTIKQNYRVSEKQNAKYIAPESRFYSMTGSFLKLFSNPGGGIGYGEVALYEPTEIGCVRIKVRNREVVAVEPVIY